MPPHHNAPSAFRTVGERSQDLDQIDLNAEFQHTLDLIEHDCPCLFLTGKAGTGKSTLLHYLRETTDRATAVLAPTGVAALNVGGQTIHSFFSLSADPDRSGYAAQTPERQAVSKTGHPDHRRGVHGPSRRDGRD